VDAEAAAAPAADGEGYVVREHGTGGATAAARESMAANLRELHRRSGDDARPPQVTTPADASSERQSGDDDESRNQTPLYSVARDSLFARDFDSLSGWSRGGGSDRGSYVRLSQLRRSSDGGDDDGGAHGGANGRKGSEHRSSFAPEVLEQLEDWVVRRESTVAELAQLEGDLLEQAMSTGVLSPDARREGGGGGGGDEEGKRRFLLGASDDGAGRGGEGDGGGSMRRPPPAEGPSAEKAARNARWMSEKEPSSPSMASPSAVTAPPPVFSEAELAAAKEPSEERLIIALCGSDEAAAVRAVAPGARLQCVGLARFTQLMARVHRLADDWETVRDAPPLASLSKEAFELVYGAFAEERLYRDGAPIVLPREAAKEVFLCLEGSCEVFTASDPAGSACALLRPGDFFGGVEALQSGVGGGGGGGVVLHTDGLRAGSSCVVAVWANPTTAAASAPLDELRAHFGAFGGPYPRPSGAVGLAQLEHVADLGSGRFGAVMLMRMRMRGGEGGSGGGGGGGEEGTPGALKLMKRAAVVRGKQCAHVLSEKQLLCEVRHPFVPRLLGTFKDAATLGMLLEFVPGGELFTRLADHPRLPEEEATFVLGCVALVLEHLHARQFVYRDIKPENLMLDARGYVKLIDFGFCKRLRPAERTFTPCGTPAYMAPEIFALEGHGFEVDWWAAGVLLYECLHDCTPFSARGTIESDLEILCNVRDEAYVVPYRPTVSKEAQQVCKGLLRYHVGARLDGATLRTLPLFSGFEWGALLHRRLVAPYVPAMSDSAFDVSRFEDADMDGTPGAKLLAAMAEAEPYPTAAADGGEPWDVAF